MTDTSNTICADEMCALEYDDHSYFRPEPFPPMPKITPTVMTRAEVLEKTPAFFDILAEAARYREENDYPSTISGIIAPRHILTGEQLLPIAAYGDALILSLPGEFAPCLVELAIQQPSVFNIDSLDLQSAQTVFGWSCTLPDGKTYCLMIPDYTLDTAGLLQCKNHQRVQVRFVQVVFVAGDSIVCGGFWFDGDELEGAHAASMYSSNYRHYAPLDEEVLEVAACRAELAGSAQPWQSGPWLDAEDGVYYMAFQLTSRRGNDERG